MPRLPTIYERAYELTGEHDSPLAIRQQLVREGYNNVEAFLSPPSVRHTLQRLCKQRRLTMKAHSPHREPPNPA